MTKHQFTVAFVVVIITMISAEIPRQRIHLAKQSLITPAPYVARGWRPAGQQFNLPVKTQQQPQQIYGPPPTTTTVEPEATTTEQPTTTPNPAQQKANLKSQEQDAEEIPQEEKQNLQPQVQVQPGQYYVVVPQPQKLVYQVPQTAQLVAVPQTGFVSTVSSGVFTPYSSSFVQIYQ